MCMMRNISHLQFGMSSSWRIEWCQLFHHPPAFLPLMRHQDFHHPSTFLSLALALWWLQLHHRNRWPSAVSDYLYEVVVPFQQSADKMIADERFVRKVPKLCVLTNVRRAITCRSTDSPDLWSRIKNNCLSKCNVLSLIAFRIFLKRERIIRAQCPRHSVHSARERSSCQTRCRNRMVGDICQSLLPSFPSLTWLAMFKVDRRRRLYDKSLRHDDSTFGTM